MSAFERTLKYHLVSYGIVWGFLKFSKIHEFNFFTFYIIRILDVCVACWQRVIIVFRSTVRENKVVY